MSYHDQESSAAAGAPFLLYEFKRGSQVWRYTNAAVPVVLSGFTWDPVALQSDDFTRSGDMTRNNLTVQFPRGLAFAVDFLKQVVYDTTSLTVYRGHHGATDRLVYWKGRVVSAKARKETVSLECEPIFTSLRRYGLRARYQKTCRHPLYGRGCNLLAASFALTGSVTDATLPTVFRFFGRVLTEKQLIGGMLRLPDGTLRHIVAQEHPSQILTLALPAFELFEQVKLDGTVAVTVYPGCDHTRATCRDKFSNLPNFGGFPYIPERNPFDGSIN